MNDDQDEYFIPLQDQRVFGAGIKRKRVQFVPAEDARPLQSAPSTQPPSNGESVANFYESLVLAPRQPTPSEHRSKDRSSAPPAPVPDGSRRCEVCHLPIVHADPAARAHESSLAHQVCLEHSHPPSHLDRRNKGLRYLSTYGWDPNSRLGLGPAGEGRLFPVKTAVKNDTLGVGAKTRRGSGGAGNIIAGHGVNVKRDPRKDKTLDAKGVKKKDDEERKRTERLHLMFYQSEEVNRYLGTEV